MGKKSFVFYRSWMEAIKELPRGEREEIYTAIIDYGLDGTLPEELTMIPKIIFELAKPQIDKNNVRYANGLLGGAPEGNQNARKKQPKTTKNNLWLNSESSNNNYEVEEREKNNIKNNLPKKTTKNNQKQPMVVSNNQHSEIGVDSENINIVAKQPKTTKNNLWLNSETDSNNNEFEEEGDGDIKNNPPDKNNQKQPNDNVNENDNEREKKVYNTSLNDYKKREVESNDDYSKFLNWMEKTTPNILISGVKLVERDEIISFISSYGKDDFYKVVRALDKWFAEGNSTEQSMYELIEYGINHKEKNERPKVKLSNKIPLITDIINEDTSQWSDEEYLDRLYPHLKGNNPYHLTEERLKQQEEEREEMKEVLHSISLRGKDMDESNLPKRDFLKYRGCVEMVREYFNEQLDKYGNYLHRWDDINPSQMEYMRERLMISGLDDVKSAIDMLACNSLISETAKADNGGKGINWLLNDKNYGELKGGVYTNPTKFPPLKPVRKKSSHTKQSQE